MKHIKLYSSKSNYEADKSNIEIPAVVYDGSNLYYLSEEKPLLLFLVSTDKSTVSTKYSKELTDGYNKDINIEEKLPSGSLIAVVFDEGVTFDFVVSAEFNTNPSGGDYVTGAIDAEMTDSFITETVTDSLIETYPVLKSYLGKKDLYSRIKNIKICTRKAPKVLCML